MARKNQDKSESAATTTERPGLPGVDLNSHDANDRKKLIASAGMLTGMIRGTWLTERFSRVSRTVWLKEARDSGVYKKELGFKTWEEFCTFLGMSKSKADKDIANLNGLGQSFLELLTEFRVGYHDLRKLRWAAEKGEITIHDGAVLIEGKAIPFDDDHKDDLKAAIECLVEEKDNLKADVNKLKKDHKAILNEETRGLRAERDNLQREYDRLKVFDPEDKDPDSWSIEQMGEIRKAAVTFSILCRRFIMDDRLQGNIPLQAQVMAGMQEVSMTFRKLRALWDEKFDLYEDIPDGYGPDDQSENH